MICIRDLMKQQWRVVGGEREVYCRCSLNATRDQDLGVLQGLAYQHKAAPTDYHQSCLAVFVSVFVSLAVFVFA